MAGRLEQEQETGALEDTWGLISTERDQKQSYYNIMFVKLHRIKLFIKLADETEKMQLFYYTLNRIPSCSVS